MFNGIKDKLSEYLGDIKENPFVENVFSYYEALSEKDQFIVKIIGSSIVVIIFFNIFFSVFSSLSNKESELNQLTLINANVDQLNSFVKLNKQKFNKIRSESMSKRFVSLLDIVEKQQIMASIKPDSRIDLKENPRKIINDGKQYENTADVKYNKITIRQLVKLLYGIEKSGLSIKIRSLKIKRRYEDIRYLDAEFAVIARTPKWVI